MIRRKKIKFSGSLVNFDGFIKINIPINQLLYLKYLENLLFDSKTKSDIRTVNRGIVPINVAATTLSTWISLKLIN